MLKNKIVALGSVVGASLLSSSAFAVDLSTEITAATTESTSNLTLAIGGVITLAILGFGVRAVVKWFN